MRLVQEVMGIHSLNRIVRSIITLVMIGGLAITTLLETEIKVANLRILFGCHYTAHGSSSLI